MSSPQILLLLLPLWVFVVVLGLTSRRGLRSPSRWIGVVLRGGVATVLMVIWAGPEQATSSARPRRLEVLFDVSGSILRQDRHRGVDAIAAHIDEWRKVAAAGDTIVVVAFAGQAEILWSGSESLNSVRAALNGLRSDAFSKSLSPESSDLTAALQLAAAGRSNTDVVQRLIFTDGACNGMDWAVSFSAVGTLLVPPIVSDHDNFRVRSLQHASWMRQGDPLQILVDYTATGEYDDVPCVLFLNGNEALRVNLRPASGQHTFTLQHLAPDDVLGEVELRVSFETDDIQAADDELAGVINILPSRSVLVVRESVSLGDSLIESALTSRGILSQRCSVADLAELQAAPGFRNHDLVVLDKVVAQSLTDAHVAALDARIQDGMGLCVFPAPGRGQLKALTESPLGALMPLVGLTPPPIATKKDNPEDEGAPRLTDQDPEDSEIQEIDAPTLALLLVIDKSTSMRDSARLSLAKAGAIATARALHPDDSIGVIVYNDRANEVVPLQPARNLPSIERAINRIRAGGATDIRRALQFSREALGRDSSAVKVVILLSDGHTLPFDPKPLLEAMVREGITVHTVGVGSGFDVGMLTQIASFGGGKGPIPARTSKEIPQVMVDVATDVMTDNKTRRAADVNTPEKTPKIPRTDHEIPAKPTESRSESNDGASGSPTHVIRVARSVSYVAGIEWVSAPPPLRIHESRVQDGAWLSLETVEGKPLLAHQHVGRGLVSTWAFDPEQDGGAAWAEWKEVVPLLAKHVDFLRRIPEPRHIMIATRATAEGLLVEGTLTRRRATQSDGVWACFVSRDGSEPVADLQSPDGVFFVPLSETSAGALDVTLSSGGVRRKTRVYLPPPNEILSRDLDLDRLREWCSRLGEHSLLGSTASDRLPITNGPLITRHESLPLKGIEVLLGLLFLEIVLRRWDARSLRRQLDS